MSTAKRASRTSTKASIPSSPRIHGGGVSSSSADVENLAGQMLLSLGISRKPTPADSTTTTFTRTTRSSSKDALSVLAASSHDGMDGMSTPLGKSRTVSASSGTGTTSSTGRSRTSTSASAGSNGADRAVPLTAIRRPAAQLQAYASASSARRVSSGPVHTALKASPKTNALASAATTTTTATRRKVSAPPTQTSTTAAHNEDGSVVAQEEYVALISLLAAKDAQIGLLQASLADSEARATTLEGKVKALEKEQSGLLGSPSLVGNGNGRRGVLLRGTSGGRNNEPDAASSTGVGNGSKGMEELKKQYEMQENLLLGFQRENEKASSEIDGYKKRERQLTDHLKKIYGPSYSLEMDLSSPSSLPSDHTHGALPTSTSSPVHEFPGPLRRRSGFVAYVSSPLSAESGTPANEGANGLHAHPLPSSAKGRGQEMDPQAVMEQLLSVQSLLDRFERRLLVRETELIKLEQEAKEEGKKVGAILMTSAAA